jgi:hypothetical protein
MAVHVPLLLHVSWKKLQSSSGGQTVVESLQSRQNAKRLSKMAGMQIPVWLLRKEKLQKYAHYLRQECPHVTNRKQLNNF